MSVSGYHRVKPVDNGGGSGIIKAVKEAYRELSWRKGGKINGRKTHR